MNDEIKRFPVLMRGKVMNRIFMFALVLGLNIIPLTAHSQVDCSALDPRVSITKEKEGQISGSVDTLYKIAKAGGSIQGRVKDEIINLQQGAAKDEQTNIRLRAIYLFCGMVANSPEIPVEKKIALFNLMVKDAGVSSPGSPGKSKRVDQPKAKPAKTTSGEPKRTILFEESFKKSGWLPEAQFPGSGRTAYQDGWYVLQNTTPSSSFFYRLTAAGYFPSAVRIQLDMRLNAGPLARPFGLLLGAPDEKFTDCLGVFIRGDGATQIVRLAGNKDFLELYLPPRGNIKIGYGAVNSLRVEIKDTELRYYINDAQIGRYKSRDRIQGHIGFYTDYPGMDVGFRNLKVTQ